MINSRKVCVILGLLAIGITLGYSPQIEIRRGSGSGGGGSATNAISLLNGSGTNTTLLNPTNVGITDFKSNIVYRGGTRYIPRSVTSLTTTNVDFTIISTWIIQEVEANTNLSITIPAIGGVGTLFVQESAIGGGAVTISVTNGGPTLRYLGSTNQVTALKNATNGGFVSVYTFERPISEVYITEATSPSMFDVEWSERKAIADFNAYTNFVWTCTNATTGEGEWRTNSASGGGVSGANGNLTNANIWLITTNHGAIMQLGSSMTTSNIGGTNVSYFTNLSANMTLAYQNLISGLQYHVGVSNVGTFTVSFPAGTYNYVNPGVSFSTPTNAQFDIFVWLDGITARTNAMLIGPDESSRNIVANSLVLSGGLSALDATMGSLFVTNNLAVFGTGFIQGGLNLTEEATPGTPAGNTAILYARDVAGVSKLYWKDDAGIATGPLGDAKTSVGLIQFAATTSAELLSVLSDKTGVGLAVFNNGPGLTNTVQNGTNTAHELRASRVVITNSLDAGFTTITRLTNTGTSVFQDSVTMNGGDVVISGGNLYVPSTSQFNNFWVTNYLRWKCQYISSASPTQNIDCALGQTIYFTNAMTTNMSLTLSNLPPTGWSQAIDINWIGGATSNFYFGILYPVGYTAYPNTATNGGYFTNITATKRGSWVGQPLDTNTVKSAYSQSLY